MTLDTVQAADRKAPRMPSTSWNSDSISTKSLPGSFHVNEKGYGWFLAAVFIVADMMGAGMVALPVAIGQSGVIPGVLILIFGALFSGFTGIQLSENWAIMQMLWPEYREHCRRPYPEMARRALGNWAKIPMDICLAITLYSITTVLLLFAAGNIQLLLSSLFDLNVNLCIIILAVGVIVWPVTMLKSPMHFWWAGVMAALTSSVAGGLIIAGAAHDASTCRPEISIPKTTAKTIFLSYGTMVFAYGGHSAFPTIQHDMREPAKFKLAVITSYIFIMLMYLLVSLVGFEIYGDSIADTIIPSLQLSWMSNTVNVLITIHVLPAIVIVLSPLNQQVEQWTNISQKFGPSRILVRTIILALCVFTAETVPSFGVVLDLVGGSTITLMTMILPSVFWLYLSTRNKLYIGKGSQNGRTVPTMKQIWDNTSKLLLVVIGISLLFGLIGGICATASAVSELFSTDMSPPCYVLWIQGKLHTTSEGSSVHCCGQYKNISITGDSSHCSL